MSVSEVVETLATSVVEVVEGLMTPSSSMVTEWLAGTVMALNRPQVATRPLRLQLPMEVVGVALLLSKMRSYPIRAWFQRGT